MFGFAQETASRSLTLKVRYGNASGASGNPFPHARFLPSMILLCVLLVYLLLCQQTYSLVFRWNHSSSSSAFWRLSRSFQCRQVHSKCKSCVDPPAEYNAYQGRDIIEHYRSAHDAKQHRWIMESPSKHFHTVRGGVEVDLYLFLQPFCLSYPKATSCVSVIRKQGKASCVNDLCLHEVSSLTPSLLVQRLRALCALLG